MKAGSHLIFSLPTEFPLIEDAPLEFISNFSDEKMAKLNRKVSRIFLDKKIKSSALEKKTDCSFTMRSLAIIFSGKERGIQLMHRMDFSVQTTMTLVLPNKFHYEFSIKDLFTGHEILSNDPQDEPHSLALKSSILSTLEKNKTVIGKCNFKQLEIVIPNLFREVSYDFNLPIHQSLTERIKNNSFTVTSERSYIYYIAITLITEKTLSYYHALTVEQYHSTKYPQEATYRIYQSFIFQMTLGNYLKRKYETKNYLTNDEFSIFLNDLKIITCKTEGNESIDAIRERCFGCPYGGPKEPFYFDIFKDSFEGLSLRYVWDEVNPKNCKKNYKEFIKASQLKKNLITNIPASS